MRLSMPLSRGSRLASLSARPPLKWKSRSDMELRQETQLAGLEAKSESYLYYYTEAVP